MGTQAPKILVGGPLHFSQSGHAYFSDTLGDLCRDQGEFYPRVSLGTLGFNPRVFLEKKLTPGFLYPRVFFRAEGANFFWRFARGFWFHGLFFAPKARNFWGFTTLFMHWKRIFFRKTIESTPTLGLKICQIPWGNQKPGSKNIPWGKKYTLG